RRDRGHFCQWVRASICSSLAVRPQRVWGAIGRRPGLLDILDRWPRLCHGSALLLFRANEKIFSYFPIKDTHEKMRVACQGRGPAVRRRLLGSVGRLRGGALRDFGARARDLTYDRFLFFRGVEEPGQHECDEGERRTGKECPSVTGKLRFKTGLGRARAGAGNIVLGSSG